MFKKTFVPIQLENTLSEKKNWAKKYHLVIAAIKFATEFFIKWFLKTIAE